MSESEDGFFAEELQEILEVGVKESLLRLVQMGRISREKISRSYLYCSKNSSVRRQQLAERLSELSGTEVNIPFKPDQVSNEVKAAIILFTALLNEKQRRLFAGIEALQFGHEAERWIAHLLGIHPQTVAKGKKELVGNFKNTGAAWKDKAIETLDHDFRSLALGITIPYGLYDPILNRGYVVVGTSKETPEFAVDCLVTWWRLEGQKHYPHSKRLLILADGGGGNASNSRVWRAHLQSKFCDRFGIAITVCHYPPGASKWNPVEHFLFSYITKNWEGEPLETYEKVLKYIRTTKTETGLKVRAQLNSKTYMKGVSISDEEMKSLCIRKCPRLPKWNYTINPRKM